MEANNLFMQYIMRFGAEELPPRMQMPCRSCRSGA